MSSLAPTCFGRAQRQFADGRGAADCGSGRRPPCPSLHGGTTSSARSGNGGDARNHNAAGACKPITDRRHNGCRPAHADSARRDGRYRPRRIRRAPRAICPAARSMHFQQREHDILRILQGDALASLQLGANSALTSRVTGIGQSAPVARRIPSRRDHNRLG